MSTTKGAASAAVVLCVGLCAAGGAWAAGPIPGVNVTVTNAPSNPVPVAVTNPLQVTVTNPVTTQAVTLSNVPVRFSGSGTGLIRQDAVPAGQVLIVSYASVLGVVDSAAAITAGICMIELVHNEGGNVVHSKLGGLPVYPGKLSASASEAMYLPVKAGEGIDVSCEASGTAGGVPLANVGAEWFVVLGGYFTDAQ